VRKFSGLILVGLVALAFSAAPVSAAQGDPVTIMVMKHACAANIQTEANFKAVEAKGGGNPVFALAQTVLACPAIANPGDTQSPGAIAGKPADFSFSVTDSAGTTVRQADAKFTPAKLCESDIKLDANGDGKISADVCLDISHYEFSGLVSGEITVTEDSPPAGFRFGTIRFTPTELQANNDKESLTGSMTQEPIKLDTSGDTDNMVMIHTYNFATSMPRTDTVSPTAPVGGNPWLAIALVFAAGTGVLVLATRRLQR